MTSENLPDRAAIAGQERLSEQVARTGMFGTPTTGDTSGYGGPPGPRAPAPAFCGAEAWAYSACAASVHDVGSASVVALISATSFDSSTPRSSMIRPSTVEATDGSSLSRCSLSERSVWYASVSAWFFASATSRSRCASSAWDSAFRIICCTSSSERPEPPSILICCWFPVPMSFAVTWMIPFASMSKATSTCGIPRGAGGMPTSWNLPSVLL